jgi:hypothetical protein
MRYFSFLSQPGTKAALLLMLVVCMNMLIRFHQISVHEKKWKENFVVSNQN